MNLKLLFLSGIFLSFFSLPIHAEAKPAPPLPISLTVSGGVSLGAYEAGNLYYSAKFIRANQFKSDLKLVTGASAGAINALLAIFLVCSDSSHFSPTESLLWKTWIPVGFRELLGTPAHQMPSALFTTEALEKSALGIEAAWMNGIDKNCDVVLGVTTTLLKPSQVKLADGIQAEHQEEPFVLRVQGRGPGRPPLISNYVDPSDAIPHALLYLPEDPHENFLALQNLLLASAAFPAAFPPVKLKLCRTRSSKPNFKCTDQLATEEYFIDGGVFDNEPLRLASRIAARGLEKNRNGTFTWRAIPNLNRRSPPSELQFKAIDVDAKTYPVEQPADEKKMIAEEKDPFIHYLSQFVSRFVATARSQQLYSVLEENPGLEKSLQSSKNNFPLASELGLAFSGFFDRGFREFDFYMGMYDGKISLINSKIIQNKEMQYPEQKELMGEDWIKFQCIEATLDHTEDREKKCTAPYLVNTKRLLQQSLDRLYSVCSGLGTGANFNSFPNRDCLKAAHGELPPQVSVETNRENWRREPEENGMAYSSRLLSQNHYQFEFIQDPNASYTEVLEGLRSEVLVAFKSLADRQPSKDQFALNFAVGPAFNFITYVPPTREYHILIGELAEAGGSVALNEWLRFHFSITSRRPQDIFSKQYGDFAIAPMLGFEVEPHALSNVWLQSRIGARMGYQFTPRDQWSSQSCSSGSNCSRIVAEPYLSATVYERLRLQLVEQILPASRGQSMDWDTFVQLGIEFTP